MPRIQWRTFDKGLWLAGGRDAVPEGGLRRATGVSQLREGAIRAVRGLRTLNLFGANQFIRFATALWQSAGADVLRNGSVINGAFPQSGLLGQVADGRRVNFLRAPPQPELTDYLFVSGGNNPFKVPANGFNASKWGIDAPADGMMGAPQDANTKPIDTCDNAASWTRVESSGTTPTDETTIAIGGATSMRFDFTTQGTNRYTKAITLNLNHFGTGPPPDFPSADQDYIELWIRLTGDTAPSEPAAQLFDLFEIAFALGAANFDDNVFARRVDIQDGAVPHAGLADQQAGVAQVRINDQDVVETDIVNSTGVYGEGADTRTLLNALSQTIIYRQNDVWQRLRLPKLSFDRTGGNNALNWSNVQAVRLTFARSGTVSVLVDQISLVGGWGLVGKYQFQQTFKNSVTGSRSNPNPTPLLVQRVDRQRVILGNLQQSADPQVDKIEIWRTVGNGAALFFDGEVDAGTTTYEDEVVDFRGLYTGVGYLTDDELPDVLQPDELLLDNDPPPATIFGVLPQPHLARAWWFDSAEGQEGRVFFSPAGRPESNAGFVECVDTDDAMTALALWNDVIFAFSRNGLFRIVGDDEPFTAQEVFGSPGTTQPDTVRVTPFGICYQAADALRLFDGSFSQPVNFDAVGPLFRGYDVEDTEAFVGMTAAYFDEDYIVGDGGTQTLIYNLRTQAWRFLQLTARTLYASEDDREIIVAASYDTGTSLSVDDVAADSPTAFDLETPARRISADTLGVVQRLFIDAETGGLVVTPTLLLDNSEVELPAFSATERTTFEYALLRLGKLVSVRLTTDVTTELLIVYGIEADVYVPAGSEVAA